MSSPVPALPSEGLYPRPWLSGTEPYGTGTLVLKGPKQLCVVPGIRTAKLGSMVALKATLMLSEEQKDSFHGLLTHVKHRARLSRHLSAGGPCRPAR